MADSNDIYQSIGVSNAIHNPPLANPDAPEICCAFQLHNPCRTGFRDQCLNLFEYAPRDLTVKVLKFFARRPREDD